MTSPERSEPPEPVERRTAVIGVAAVTASLGFLHSIGASLDTPPVFDLRALAAWFSETEPASAMFSMLRIGGIGAGWYLVASTALQVAARIARVGGLTVVADIVSIPVVRHVASGLVGLTISATSASAPEAAPAFVTMERVTDPSGLAVLQRLPSGETMYQVSGGDDEDDDTAVLRRVPAPTVTTEAAPRQPRDDVWTAACGDHLWTISEETLAEAWGRTPTDAEIVPYWRQVVAANGLPDPDLLFPGQTIALPTPPGAPA